MVPNFFAGFPEVGSSTKHTLVSDHSDCELVNQKRVVLPAHYLRGHIARCSRCVLCIVFPPNSRNPKISYPQIAIALNHEILRFDISVQNVLCMHVFKSSNETRNKKSCRLFVKLSVATDMISEVSAWEVVHDQVKILSVLKSIVHVDNVDVVQLRKDLPFVDDRLNRPLCDDPGFRHLLHRERLCLSLSVNLPYFPETSLPNAVMIDKIFFWNR